MSEGVEPSYEIKLSEEELNEKYRCYQDRFFRIQARIDRCEMAFYNLESLLHDIYYDTIWYSNFKEAAREICYWNEVYNFYDRLRLVIERILKLIARIAFEEGGEKNG